MKEEKIDFEDDDFNIDDLDDLDSDESDNDDNAAKESDGTVEDQRAPVVSGGLVEMLKENIVYVIVGLVVVIGGGYFAYDTLFSSSTPKPAPKVVRHSQQQSQGFGLTTTPANVKVTPLNLTKPNHKTSAVVTPSDDVTMTQADLKALMQGFQKIVTTNDGKLIRQEDNLQKIVIGYGKSISSQQKSMATQLGKLQKTMSSVSKQINSSESSLSKLDISLIKTQAELKLLVAEKAAGHEKLSLRAVVPGRAWLVNQKGQTITLTVGQALKYYGKVVSINSKTNKVYMSSGYVFN